MVLLNILKKKLFLLNAAVTIDNRENLICVLDFCLIDFLLLFLRTRFVCVLEFCSCLLDIYLCVLDFKNHQLTTNVNLRYRYNILLLKMLI